MAKVKRRVTYKNVDPFRPIESTTKIGEYLGIHRTTFSNHYLQEMIEQGLIWQRPPMRKSSAWVTTPLMLNIYFHNRAKQQAKDKRLRLAEHGRTQAEQRSQIRDARRKHYKVKRGLLP